MHFTPITPDLHLLQEFPQVRFRALRFALDFRIVGVADIARDRMRFRGGLRVVAEEDALHSAVDEEVDLNGHIILLLMTSLV